MDRSNLVPFHKNFTRRRRFAVSTKMIELITGTAEIAHRALATVDRGTRESDAVANWILLISFLLCTIKPAVSARDGSRGVFLRWSG